MKNLVIDIGNTAVKMAVMDENNSIIEYSHDENIHTQLISSIISRYGIHNSIWISTRKLDMETETFLASMTPEVIHFEPGIIDVPIKVNYDNPLKLGADRLALAVGVWRKLPKKDSLIFDFGTALTIDFLSEKGIFMGGCISPGLKLRLLSLHEHTGALPLIEELTGSVHSFPTNTCDAISQGVYRSMYYEILGHIKANEHAEIVFSGYDAKYFVDKFKITIFAQYDILLLEGLNEILKNVKCHKTI